VLLALETTCDETAAAVISERLEVLGAVVASQDALHARFGGIVPELASRAHVERMLPVIDEALRRAGLGPRDLTLVAVANTPGLAGSLLVGLAAAKALALALGLPLVAIDHVHAHLYACRIEHGPGVFPALGLVVSGGHTSLFACHDPLRFELLGGTTDDAAGEAFDKVASLLGLGFPGGPAIERAAATGNPRAFALPRTYAHEPERLEFSFSGLKTAVRYLIAPPGARELPRDLPPARVADLAASFQEAAVETLLAKTEHALDRTGLGKLCVGGGVAANGRLRAGLEALGRRRGVEVYLASKALSTDNAVMGALAWDRYRAGLVESLDLDVFPGLVR
jgi:N6-L-threonylcarbamoyladenine synthase